MKHILRWMPAAILLALFGLLWKTAVFGGEQGVVAWLTLMGGLPYLGMLILLIAIVVLIWKRKLNLPLIATLLVAILVIWPYLWRFGMLPMAYPISLETTEPAATVRLPANEPLLVAWGGDTPDVNYHVTFQMHDGHMTLSLSLRLLVVITWKIMAAMECQSSRLWLAKL